MFSGNSTTKYKKGKGAKYADSVGAEDQDDEDEGVTAAAEEGLSISATTFVSGGRHSTFPGGPFSALTNSMCPADVSSLVEKVEFNGSEWRWDEFGYRVQVEPHPERKQNKLVDDPFLEDPQHRLRWIAHLEFTHNQVVTEDLTWDKIEAQLPKTDKLASMVRSGVPHSLRPFIWPRLCGAITKKRRANFSYKEAVRAAQKERPAIAKQIEKDLLRTLPTNICFMSLESPGISRLRRILRAISYLYPDIGYCQGMGVIVSTLLLFMEEEDGFWIMCTIIEDLLPASYFSGNLLGLQADQRVLRQLCSSYLPEIESGLAEHDIELSLITLHWFLTLFASVLHTRVLLRIWDILLYEGTGIMFQVTLAILKMREAELVSLNNSAEIFNLLSDLPGFVDDAERLLDLSEKVAPSVTDSLLSSLRKKQLALLMVDQGVLINPNTSDETNLPKQRIQRRKLKRSQSFVQSIFGSSSHLAGSRTGQRKDSAPSAYDDQDPRMKNVHQTELLVDLKDSILRVARHFLTVDPNAQHYVTLQSDYSPESHAQDHEVYLAGRRTGNKRARALLDFQRQEEDELGFRKNDVITILSQRDEHCWVGELNGLRGWFPAKFVEILDERGKCYSALGDDAVTEGVTDLVRGDFCHTFKEVMEHGMKRSMVLGVACHPWLFIEEVASKEVQKDFDSVYSRLVLCRTFRLDEDGKVLTPEELLYRSVQRINATHDAARALMDVKLRSLVCIGLNEQALHLWYELFCSSQETVRKWYYPWSFIRSPGWVQIKCELRLLAQFCFNLNPDFELPVLGGKSDGGNQSSIKIASALAAASRTAGLPDKPLKEGVRDMLVKHHLFSWKI